MGIYAGFRYSWPGCIRLCHFTCQYPHLTYDKTFIQINILQGASCYARKPDIKGSL